MKTAYFFINGILESMDESNDYDYDYIELDNQYRYIVKNFGVRRDFEKCKSGAYWDLQYDVFGKENIIPNSFIGIFKIDIDKDYYDDIEDCCAFADGYDVWETIIENKDKLFYSVKYDENKNQIENFVNINEIEFEV